MQVLFNWIQIYSDKINEKNEWTQLITEIPSYDTAFYVFDKYKPFENVLIERNAQYISYYYLNVHFAMTGTIHKEDCAGSLKHCQPFVISTRVLFSEVPLERKLYAMTFMSRSVENFTDQNRIEAKSSVNICPFYRCTSI